MFSISEGEIRAMLDRSAITVAVVLSAFVCLAILTRARWPGRVVGAVTLAAIVLVLLASPWIVLVAAGPTPRIAAFLGVVVRPGPLVAYGPGVVAALAGLSASCLLRRAAKRRDREAAPARAPEAG